MPTLRLCDACSRHFRLAEKRCPFCQAVPASLPEMPALSASLSGASRSHRYAVRAALLAGSATACGQTTDSQTDRHGALDGSVHSSGGLAGGGSGGRVASGGTAGGSATGGIFVVIETGGSDPGSGGFNGVEPTGRACAGYVESASPYYALCRSEADCGPQERCDYPPGERTCLVNAPRECTSDADCPASTVCRPFHCSGSVCVERCDPDVCAGARRCTEFEACAEKGCSEAGGVACADGYTCRPGSFGATPTGCVPESCGPEFPCAAPDTCTDLMTPPSCNFTPCSVDEDCSCGYCVAARCRPTLGVCQELLAMPYGCVWPDEEWV